MIRTASRPMMAAVLAVGVLLGARDGRPEVVPRIVGPILSGYRGGMETTATTGMTLTSEPTATPVISEHIGIKPGHCGGQPHILGHRIKVKHVAIWYERMGLSPDEIVSSHPGITLAQVHAALAYYYDHRDEVDRSIREGQEFADKIRGEAPSIFEKVRQRNAQDDSLPPG